MMSLKIGKKPRREEDGSTGMELVAGNVDLLSLILLRQPVKSLLRFKSVSKHWLSLISDPQFRILNSKRCCKHTSGIILKPLKLGDNEFNFVPLDQDDLPAPFESLDFVGADTRLDVIEYCNGLLLCRSKRELSTETKCYIINVTTKQHTAVSLPVSAGKGFRLYSVALAFDPRISPHFKLICLYCNDLGVADYCVRIYSSETGLMTQLSDIFHSSSDILLSSGFYWNGAINWFDFISDGLYFNVTEERFGVLPMPPEPQDNYGRISYYGESNDHLFLAQTNTTPATRLAVYEMDREYSGWFVKFHVDLRPMFRAFPTAPTISERLPEPFSILAIVDRDDGENSFIVFGGPGKAIRFHLKDRVFTKICDFSGVNDEGYLPIWAHSIQFIESLHPL